MFRTRLMALTLGFSLLLLCAPAAFGANCSCHFCVPGNLTAPCFWNAPGQGNVECVDYWEFNCMMGGGNNGGGGQSGGGGGDNGGNPQLVSVGCEAVEAIEGESPASEWDETESGESAVTTKETEDAQATPAPVVVD